MMSAGVTKSTDAIKFDKKLWSFNSLLKTNLGKAYTELSVNRVKFFSSYSSIFLQVKRASFFRARAELKFSKPSSSLIFIEPGRASFWLPFQDVFCNVEYFLSITLYLEWFKRIGAGFSPIFKWAH